ncbi:MAG: calcium-binding protein [Isosphaeraceae bacterium]
MSKPSSRKFQPSLMGLESRRLLAARIPVDLGDGDPITIEPGPAVTPAFKTDLSVKVTVDHRTSPASESVEVSGSDYDDRIMVENYIPHGGFMLHLEQWSNGVRLSSRDVPVNIGSNQFNSLAISGRGGNDQILNHTALGMYADGGDGNDTIVGGSEFDYLMGGNGNDYIRGGAGDDYIFDYAGNNFLYGDAGNDRITVGGLASNTDRVEGNDGDDILSSNGYEMDSMFGGAGNDILYGGAGNDYLDGGDGNDQLWGDTTSDASTDGNDVMYGGNGDDMLNGGGGNDSLSGDAGNDRMFGGSGQDYLYGGDGNDYLDGGYIAYGDINVADMLYGGAGADTFVRHKSVFGFDDLDRFVDYSSAQGDSTDNVWHW